jgi:glycosyltransferase involved in cell wall biosynthesis
MNVVFCSPGLTFQMDAPHSTRQRANAMAAHGLQVSVVGFPPTFPADLGPCNFTYVSVLASQHPARQQRWLRWKQRLGPYWSHLIEPYLVKRAAFRHARKTNADVQYVSHVEPWLFLFLAWRNHTAAHRIPTVAMIPTIFSLTAGRSLSAKIRGWLNQAAAKWLPRYCEVICDNIHIPRLLGIAQYSTVHIIPEGHENLPVIPSQSAARTALGIPQDKRMLMLFGVAGRSKGADILFTAMDGLPPSFRVCVVGKTGGVYEPSWGQTDQLKANGWGDSLQVVSRYVTEAEMAQYYSACDGIVLPYRQGFAITSGNLMRAIEYGKAIIVSDQYYIGEVVRNNKLGLLFPPEDAQALRRCLTEFAEKPDAWFEKIRQNSRRVVQDQSWANIGLMYRRLFEQMTAATQPTSKPKP